MKAVVKTGWLILAWTLVILGFLGLFLPFVQGLLLLVFGVGILSFHSEWAKRTISLYRARHPSFDLWYGRLEKKLIKQVGRK